MADVVVAAAAAAEAAEAAAAAAGVAIAEAAEAGTAAAETVTFLPASPRTREQASARGPVTRRTQEAATKI